MNRYKYANAIQDNLWEELTKVAHADGTLDKQITVKDIMDTWTLRKGYPVVQVNRAGNDFIVTQKWFLLNPLNKIQNNDVNEYNKYKWFVPFTYTTLKENDFSFEKSPIWLKPTDSQSIIFLI